MIIILSYITFFSLIGFALFSNDGYKDPAEYFEDIPTTMFNVYVMFTTSNFPDILFPFWKINNSSAILMVGFLLIGLYMLLNFMLAVFYNSYKQQIEKKISKYDNMR
jgi:cytochrome bd-type quinol oxidase subunit 2